MMIAWLKSLFAKRPADIRIAEIYEIFYALSLRRGFRNEGFQCLVDMSSGKQAVYEWRGYEGATNVDWGWHTMRFKRYASATDATLPSYSNPPGRKNIFAVPL